MIRFAGATPAILLASVGLPIVLHEGLGIDPSTAVAIGLASAFVLSFVLQRMFVFRSDGPMGREAILFLVMSLIWRLAEYGAFRVLYAMDVAYLVALVVVLAISACFKFLICRYLIFTPRELGGGGSDRDAE